MNTSKRVVLIVDNPYRDLPGLVLVAHRLCQAGVICYLVPFNLQGSEIWPLAPDVVLLNYLRRTNETFARTLTQAGIPFGVLDTEGGVLTKIENYALTMAEDADVRSQAACFCSWGPRLAEHASKAGWYRQEQMTVTGAPRFDFYTEPWRQVALQTAGYAQRYKGNLILINGSFPLANPGFQSPEAEVEMYVERFGRPRDTLLASQQVQHRAMCGVAALANRLAHRFPSVTFVYRPHPFERMETYEQLLESHPNLHLIKTGTVDGWILRSKAVIQRTCSTAFEAGMAGVPVLSPAWIPAHKVPAIEDVSLQCSSEDELVETMEAILAGRFRPTASIRERLTEVIHDWFFRIDGRAHARVTDAILHSLDAHGGQVRLDKCRDIAYGLGRPGTSLRWMARATLAKALGLSVHWSFRRWGPVLADLSRWDNSEKYFDARQVRILVDAIQACAQDGSKEPLRKVGVQPAQERGDYYFGYLQGRSVTVFPQ